MTVQIDENDSRFINIEFLKELLDVKEQFDKKRINRNNWKNTDHCDGWTYNKDEPNAQITHGYFFDDQAEIEMEVTDLFKSTNYDAEMEIDEAAIDRSSVPFKDGLYSLILRTNPLMKEKWPIPKMKKRIESIQIYLDDIRDNRLDRNAVVPMKVLSDRLNCIEDLIEQRVFTDEVALEYDQPSLNDISQRIRLIEESKYSDWYQNELDLFENELKKLKDSEENRNDENTNDIAERCKELFEKCHEMSQRREYRAIDSTLLNKYEGLSNFPVQYKNLNMKLSDSHNWVDEVLDCLKAMKV